jgi:hypothetical protein
MYKLTCRLFRQAEYYELLCQTDESYKNLSKELYERSISLRLNSLNITPLYKQLEKLIVSIKTPIKITEKLNFIERSANKYYFTCTKNNGKHHELYIKIAALYTLITHISLIVSKENSEIDTITKAILEKCLISCDTDISFGKGAMY